MFFKKRSPLRRYTLRFTAKPEARVISADDFTLEHAGGLGYLVFTVRRRRFFSGPDVVVATYPAADLAGLTSEELQ